MPFVSTDCSCLEHDEWHHGNVDPASLRIATSKEGLYCVPFNRGHNKTRKRKICLACRGRIEVEEKYRRLTNVEPEESGEDDVHISEENLHEEPINTQEAMDTEFSLPATCQRGTQIPTLPGKPYQDATERTQRDMRSQIIDYLKNFAMKYVHNDSGPALQDMMADIMKIKKWQGTFGCVSTEADVTEESNFLDTLAKEYRSCKDKLLVKEIKDSASKQKQKFLIGNTKAKSRIAYLGATPEAVSTRVEAAKMIGRIRHYSDEKRRLLSIVALHYSYRCLQGLFGCSPNAVTAARVHCILFGRGGTPPPSLKFSRQRVSPEVLEEFNEFLHRDGITRASSCRSVMVGGQETPVRYWQDTIKNVAQQYCLEFPNGVKRTYIYSHLPQNFRSDTMLAGLCNLCDEFGHSNFDCLCSLVEQIGSVDIGINSSALIKELRKYQTFLKTQFTKLIAKHSPCLELCASYALGTCTESHTHACPEINYFHNVCKTLSESVECSAADTTKIKEQLTESITNHWNYVGHLIRTKHQGDYYRYVLKNLKPGQCVVVVDYKMKLELGKRMREIQRDWYGKRGISIFGFYVVAKVSETERKAEVIDLWSEDTKQDAWFSESAMDVGFTWMETAFPGFELYLFSDNGPHFHNTSFLVYLAEVNSAFNLKLVEYNNFEAGEGKTVLDTHFAHVSHRISRWVRVGNNLESGEQLSDIISSIKNTTCLKLSIDRQKAPKDMRTLKDITLFGNFVFPRDGQYKDGVTCRSMAGVGKEMKKSKSQLQAISNREMILAGATGAEVGESLPESVYTDPNISSSEIYSLRFVQHAPQQLQQPNITPVEVHPHHNLLPSKGFALKEGGAKRSHFTQAQKDIMIFYYDRQALHGIRANPKDVIKEMRDRGIEELKESQIKSWWSTYHSKKKKAMEEMLEACNATASLGISEPSSATSQVTRPPPPTSSAAPTPTPPPSATSQVTPLPPPTSSATPSPTPPPSANSQVTPLPPPTSSATPTPAPPPSATSQVTPQPPPTSSATPSPTPPPSATSQVTPLPPPTSSATPTPAPPPSATSQVTPQPPPTSSATPSPAPPPSATSQVTPQPPPTSSTTPSPAPPPSATSQVTPQPPPTSSATPSPAPPSLATSQVTPPTRKRSTRSSVAIIGVRSLHNPQIVEWHMQSECSQSTILGRNGSNACTFIALFFGNLFFKAGLKSPTNGIELDNNWKVCVRQAIISGNEIHDDIFEHDPINVDVEEAEQIAGGECHVKELSPQLDIFGKDAIGELSSVFKDLASRPRPSCSVVVSNERSFLFIVNTDGSTMMFDSHHHHEYGALICYAQQSDVGLMAPWLARMMSQTWKCGLQTASVTPVVYNHS